MKRSFFAVSSAAGAAALWFAAGLAAAAVSVGIMTPGVFALAGKTSAIAAAMNAAPRNSPLQWDLAFTLTHAGAKIPIADYDVELTKKMHLIAIDDAFVSFTHVHPTLDAGGEFHQRLTFPKAALYHLYADTLPHGSPQQVFRFDFVAGTPSGRQPLRIGAPAASRAVVNAGGYTIRFTVPALRAGREAAIAVHVEHAGSPANDLRPYLGAAAHVVMISTNDLSYIHVHPTLGSAASMAGMDMSHMEPAAGAPASGPDMMVHLTPGGAGLYRMWFQFANAGGAVYVAPLTLAVR